ncbi:DUF1657 domain-containing protein [Lentibacillus sediminis]|uniref:DUF1657 domain-containing protein n=1 Tax=Lentibacillus sediminis TaxID=1940529 RepID=UPI000C1C0440|nr:DUF1657 domain-containing protein [Lentibacillus sediminis]
MTVGSQVKSCYSSLKNVEATLDVLANQAQKQESQQAFFTASQAITEIKTDLQQQVIQLTKEEPQYK